MTARRARMKTQKRLAIAILVIACACGDSATEPPPDGPDLIVSVPVVPASVAYGSAFHMDVTVEPPRDALGTLSTGPTSP